MSCGRPHDVDCAEILDRVYVFLDDELHDQVDAATIRRHLVECGPCLRQYDLERAVKALVARSCGCDCAPEVLRVKVLARIREVRPDVAER